MSFVIFSILSNVCETTFSCACVLIPFVPPFLSALFFFAHCVILFVCLLSICNSYNRATSFDGVFLLVAFHYIALACNYCFLLVPNGARPVRRLAPALALRPQAAPGPCPAGQAVAVAYGHAPPCASL